MAKTSDTELRMNSDAFKTRKLHAENAKRLANGAGLPLALHRIVARANAREQCDSYRPVLIVS